LSTTDLSVVDRLQKPDFINNPQNYFSANIETMKDQAQLPTKFPSLAESEYVFVMWWLIPTVLWMAAVRG